jgi:3-oxoacyl-[acyl-carrier-protein] synthase II
MKTTGVVITGIGIISNLGFSKEEYWANRREQVRPEHITGFDTSICKAKKAYQITGFDPRQFIDRRYIKPLDTVTRFCIAGCGLALKDARLDIESDRIGIVAGSKYHGIYSIFDLKQTYYEDGVSGVSPLLFPGSVFNAAGAQAAIEWKASGPNCVINTGMASGLSSIIKAAEYVQTDKADAMVAGGNEMLHEYIFTKYDNLGCLSTGANGFEQSRPFDRNRNGMILGEGACYVVLESLEAARKRNAHIYAELVHWRSAFCANDDQGLQSRTDCVKDTLRVNGADYVDRVDLVVTDACGGRKCDDIQAKIVVDVFSRNNPYVTSNKASIGHTLGASGAFNVAEALLSIQNQGISPIRNLKEPEVQLNYVTDYLPAKIEYVLVTAYDPGGNSAALLIKRC